MRAWIYPTLRSWTRNVFGVQLYKNNARVLLSRVLSILNSDWLNNMRSECRVYDYLLFLLLGKLVYILPQGLYCHFHLFQLHSICTNSDEVAVFIFIAWIKNFRQIAAIWMQPMQPINNLAQAQRNTSVVKSSFYRRALWAIIITSCSKLHVHGKWDASVYMYDAGAVVSHEDPDCFVWNLFS